MTSESRLPRILLDALLVVALLLARDSGASTTTADPAPCPDLTTDGWPSVLVKHGITVRKDEFAILVFDHKASAWSVHHYSKCEGPDCKPTDTRQDETFGPDGNPLVLRNGNEKLLVLIMQTNPFLYAYEGVVLPPQDSPDAAALGKLAGALGSAGAGVLRTVRAQASGPAIAP